MTKLILTFSLTFLISFSFYSQDIILKKTGEEIEAQILEVNQDEIKYKKFNNKSGPIFTITKSLIFMISYENGTKDVFSTDESESLISQEDMRIKAKRDSRIYYTGKKSGAGWTAASTILFSPLIGIIPAGVITSAEPSDKNLNYQDDELMKNYDYNKVYVEEAHKTKKKKVWTGFGVGSGAWLLLILLL